jgi:hypothetical protein
VCISHLCHTYYIFDHVECHHEAPHYAISPFSKSVPIADGLKILNSIKIETKLISSTQIKCRLNSTFLSAQTGSFLSNDLFES